MHNMKYTGERPLSCQCAILLKMFDSKSRQNRHTLAHYNDNTPCIACPQCERKFNSSSPLNRHHLAHTGERSHPCDQCEKSFKQAAKISNHKKCTQAKCHSYVKCIFKQHNAKRHFQCLRCKSSSKQKSNFRAHAKMHVDIDSETFYIFKMCSSKFNTNNKLK